MESLLRIAANAAIAYVYLLVIVRLAGKHTIAEGTPFDLVVALLISDLTGDIVFSDVPVEQGLVAIGTLAVLHLLVVSGAARSPALDRLVEPRATPLIEEGALMHRNLEFERINTSELDVMLRECGIDVRGDVQTAMLEPSGVLTIRRMPGAEPAQKRDRARLSQYLKSQGASQDELCE
jgi:uncharacterized membrane protein YcaP (DUF421 family)